MGVRDRLRRRRGTGTTLAEDAAHLATWCRTHRGVEAYVEPPSAALRDFTVVLVADDGSWTRRRVAGARAVRRLGEELEVPVYDVWRTGYPQRMRDHDERERVLRRRQYRADLE